MPFVESDGIRLAYQRSGAGEPVLLIMGSGAAGHVWSVHQTPALNAAGYQTVTFDNRGIAPSHVPAGPSRLADFVADTRGLIQALDLAPCHIVGTSLGALIAQELVIGAPELVRSAVLLATRARSDATRRALTAAHRALWDSGAHLPAGYLATRSVLEMFSPATLNDDAAVTSWLDVFAIAGGSTRGGQVVLDEDGDRRAALRTVSGVPCLVVAYSDDLVCPPHLGAEVAGAIPGCDLVEIRDCGHLGHLERPEEVNAAIIAFLAKHSMSVY